MGRINDGSRRKSRDREPEPVRIALGIEHPSGQSGRGDRSDGSIGNLCPGVQCFKQKRDLQWVPS